MNNKYQKLAKKWCEEKNAYQGLVILFAQYLDNLEAKECEHENWVKVTAYMCDKCNDTMVYDPLKKSKECTCGYSPWVVGRTDKSICPVHDKGVNLNPNPPKKPIEELNLETTGWASEAYEFQAKLNEIIKRVNESIK